MALVAASFTLGLAITWQRWGNPLIDCPREMDQPLRLLKGEALYSDVRHLYGPLAPYLNAGLYRLFGPSLAVLYSAGAVSAAVILALLYWIARRFMEPAPSAAATSIVLWTCALNPSGTYVLPYAYSSTYGCLLGLLTLEMLLRFIQRGSGSPLVAAGIAAGLTTLTKTEMGLVGLATGCLATLAFPFHPSPLPKGDRGTRLAAFLFPAVAVITVGYAPIVARLGWHALAFDTFIFPLPGTFPPELVHYNRLISGLNEPLANLYRTGLGLIRLALVGGLIALCASLLARGVEVHPRLRVHLPPLALLAVTALASRFLRTSSAFRWLHWGQGIFRGLPLLLLVLLALLARRWWREARERRVSSETFGLFVLCIYAAISLARIPLRAAADTVYAATLLPPSIIVLAWLAISMPRLVLPRQPAKRLAGHLAVAVLFGYALWAAAVDAQTYRGQPLGTISTERGTMKALPELADAFGAAITFVLAETRAGEPVAVVPEGTSINFLTDRPNPLREESVHPGILDANGELDAIARLEAHGVRFVLIANRSTWMYGKPVFGTDYCTQLMAWVEERFEPVATFGRGATAATRLGDQTFFIRAYRRKDARS